MQKPFFLWTGRVLLMSAIVSLLTGFHLLSVPLTKEEKTGVHALNVQAALLEESDKETGEMPERMPEPIPTSPLPDAAWRTFDALREELLGKILTIELSLPLNVPTMKRSWRIPLAEHPSWIILEQTPQGVRAMLAVAEVQEFLEREITPLLPAPVSARILALPNEENPHAIIEGSPRDGWVLARDTARGIVDAVADDTTRIVLPVKKAHGTMVNATDISLSTFTLLGRGRSHFAGSVPNRAHNVRKALREVLDGTLLPPGTVASFNALLAVSDVSDWKLALGIFNGDQFALTPGGGICQVSTTLYRALLAAGLSIKERHPHSMYIRFYEKFGEGLDASIYPGVKDLIFTNDTRGYLLVHAYEDGDEAVVELYGTPDGRTVTLEGPFRMKDAPSDIRRPDGAPVGPREIAWRHRILRPEGTVEESTILSRYTNGIPKARPEGAEFF